MSIRIPRISNGNSENYYSDKIHVININFPTLSPNTAVLPRNFPMLSLEFRTLEVRSEADTTGHRKAIKEICYHQKCVHFHPSHTSAARKVWRSPQHQVPFFLFRRFQLPPEDQHRFYFSAKEILIFSQVKINLTIQNMVIQLLIYQVKYHIKGGFV